MKRDKMYSLNLIISLGFHNFQTGVRDRIYSSLDFHARTVQIFSSSAATFPKWSMVKDK